MSVRTVDETCLTRLDFTPACTEPHHTRVDATVAVVCREGCWTQLYCQVHYARFRSDVDRAIARRGHIGCRTCQHITRTIDELATVTPL